MDIFILGAIVLVSTIAITVGIILGLYVGITVALGVNKILRVLRIVKR